MATIANPGQRGTALTATVLSRKGEDYVLVFSSPGAWQYIGAAGVRSTPFGPTIVGYKCFWG